MKALHKIGGAGRARLAAIDDRTTHTIAKRLPEDAMTEFLDRLEAHDMAADIFLPVEFTAACTWATCAWPPRFPCRDTGRNEGRAVHRG